MNCFSSIIFKNDLFWKIVYVLPSTAHQNQVALSQNNCPSLNYGDLELLFGLCLKDCPYTHKEFNMRILMEACVHKIFSNFIYDFNLFILYSTLQLSVVLM